VGLDEVEDEDANLIVDLLDADLVGGGVVSVGDRY
jgi:hypothetical protein